MSQIIKKLCKKSYYENGSQVIVLNLNVYEIQCYFKIFEN